MSQFADEEPHYEDGSPHGADPRFVQYYEQESLSQAAIERFRAVRDKAIKLTDRTSRQGRTLRILDVGCGAGTQCFVYSELGHEVAGVDINRPLIEIARNRAVARGCRGEFRIGSATDLPFNDASFDICLLNELLEHVADWKRCLDEAVRVLKPGGVLYISTTNVLCPVQQEFELPMYSWYPGFVKRRCEALARTSKPHWANYATYPAVNWFSYRQLRRYLGAHAMYCLDRFDLMDPAGLPRLFRPLLGIVRDTGMFRALAYVIVTGTILYGIKSERLESTDSQRPGA